MIVKLLTEHHLEILSLNGDCTGSSDSTLVKRTHCWKSHVAAQMCVLVALFAILRTETKRNKNKTWAHSDSFRKVRKRKYYTISAGSRHSD